MSRENSEDSPEDLARWDREEVWHAFTQMSEYTPWIIESAQGCWLTDIHGRRYLDGVSSLWCNVHGHRHPQVDRAVREQLERVAHVTSLGMSNPTTIRLAHRLVELSPVGLQHVFFSDSGASAVEVAVKMAFQYWQQRSEPRPEKTRFIALDQAYHGDTLGSVSIGGVARFHEMFRPLLFDVLRLPAPDTYRLPPGVSADEACDYYLGQLEAMLKEHHGQVAAMVIEPLVQGAAGMIMQPRGFLRGVRELTRRYEVLLVADEVAVGMGRTGTMFACEQDVSPDLLCVAKGITGGYLPLAATLATTEIWRAFLGRYDEYKTFFHGHTYGGNPLGAAAAIATLDVFEQEKTLEQLPIKMERLALHLRRIAELPAVGDTRQCGMIGAVELVRDKGTKEPHPWHERRGMQVCETLRGEGVWLRPLGNVLVVMPPLSISLDEIDLIGNAIHKVLL
ncbi:MAG: adenosylmethionine--8-amino-7-oxononanoate transaminase [Planctomycetota bacterium]|nr:adenosylmethionine--8-amino-7-oxononanoate transaminase [Planctomycetota bacterium]